MNTIEKYIKSQSLEIYRQIGIRKIIYLDTNFWITLLDQKDELAKLFYEKIDKLFETGKCIFPVSEIVIAEICKQSDIAGKYRNTQIIDKFSCGFAVVIETERRKIEFKNWLQKKIGIEKFELKELIWSKVSFAKLGYSLPKLFDNTLLQKQVELQILEYVEHSSLLDVEMGNSHVFKYNPNPKILNDEIQKHSHEHKTFRDLVLAEILGILQEQKSTFANTVIDDPLIEKNYLTAFIKNGISKGDYYLETVFKHFHENHMVNDLPVFHVVPVLFAQIRFKNIKYKGGNDTLDFLHASVALPYCDYFFTDRKLYLRIKETELDKKYNCIVEHDLKKAIELLDLIQ